MSVVAGLPVDRWAPGESDRVEKPALVISGDRDEFADAAVLRELVERRFARPRIEIVTDADHFLTGRLDVLEEKVLEFAEAVAGAGVAA